MVTSANHHHHQALYGLWMRGADWASAGDGGGPGEAGTSQEQGLLRHPATCCYSYTADSSVHGGGADLRPC